MKATLPWTSALLAITLAAPLASADPYYSPILNVPLQVGPDACGPGYYTVFPDGSVFGPSYWLRPATGPFNGPCMAVGQKTMANQLGPPTAFPTHPYVRGPRDFFMWRENMEDQMRRDQRPALVP